MAQNVLQLICTHLSFVSASGASHVMRGDEGLMKGMAQVMAAMSEMMQQKLATATPQGQGQGQGEVWLLWRGSQHGFTADEFHKRCDNQGRTLVLVRASNGSVFGGLSTAPWQSSGGWVRQEFGIAFVFSLRRHSTTSPILFALAKPQRATSNDQNYGPIFGGFSIRGEMTSSSAGACDRMGHGRYRVVSE